MALHHKTIQKNKQTNRSRTVSYKSFYFHNILIFSEMASQTDDSLDILRQRVKCPVCMQIFNKPKRLPNCSHVFCLSCIKRHMELKQTFNFPPCPMCRKPISIFLANIDSLEPAKAEEDIIVVVTKYETCDICKKERASETKVF